MKLIYMNVIILWYFNYFFLLQDLLHLKLCAGPNSSTSDRIKRRNIGDKVAENTFLVKGELILSIEC